MPLVRWGCGVRPVFCVCRLERDVGAQHSGGGWSVWTHLRALAGMLSKTAASGEGQSCAFEEGAGAHSDLASAVNIEEGPTRLQPLAPSWEKRVSIVLVWGWQEQSQESPGI